MSDSSEPTTTRERLASTSPGLLITALVLAIIVAGAAGFGIGVKVEQSRKSSKTKSTAAAAAARRRALAKKKKTTAVTEVIGKVASNSGKRLTLKDSKGKTISVSVAKTAAVRTASKGSASDLSKGSRMLILFAPKSYTTAREIVVLPGSGKAGLMATTATTGSVSYRGRKGKTITVKTGFATVDKTSVGKLANVKKDANVIVMTRRYGKSAVATEIIVLPAGSAFA
jgi:hypothetical protein